MSLQDILNVTAVLSNVATFLGIPVAIFVLVRDRRLSRRAAELDTYQVLQAEYSHFLRLCLEHPDLGLYDYKPQSVSTFSPEQYTLRMIGFEIWVSMCESAFFLYHRDHHSQFYRRQWTGWEEYIRDWAERDDFRQCWREHLGYQFDSAFVNYVNGIVEKVEQRHNQPLQPTGAAS